MGQKLTDRTTLTSIAPGDLLHVVDVSDTTDSAQGTSKKITQDNLIPDSSDTVKGKVELATSAETITGTDTVRAVTPAGAAAAYQPLDSDLTAFASHPTYITTLNINPLFAPQGFLINGKIVPSVSSNNLTVALKTLAGNDPSATDPVYCRIGDTVRSITASLSKTLNAGTNYFNAGSAELATKEIDYFVYLGFKAADSTVHIGFSRRPDFNVPGSSGTATSESCLTLATGDEIAATDTVEVIGRFAATLSAGAGYTWTVPTFTVINLVQRPIYETRWLSWLPTYSANGSMTFGTVTTTTAKYNVLANRCALRITATGTTGGSASNALFMTTPFTGIASYAGSGATVVDTTAIAGQAIMGYGDVYTYFAFLKYDASNYGLGTGRGCYAGIISYEI